LPNHSVLTALISIVERDGGIYWYGAQGSGRLDDSTADLWKQGDVKLVGDHSGPICAIFKSRSVFLWIAEDSKPRFVHEPRLGNEISHIAIAGNGRVCVVKGMFSTGFLVKHRVSLADSQEPDFCV